MPTGVRVFLLRSAGQKKAITLIIPYFCGSVKWKFIDVPYANSGRILGILRMGVCGPRIHGKKPYARVRRGRTEHGTPVRFEYLCEHVFDRTNVRPNWCSVESFIRTCVCQVLHKKTTNLKIEHLFCNLGRGVGSTPVLTSPHNAH